MGKTIGIDLGTTNSCMAKLAVLLALIICDMFEWVTHLTRPMMLIPMLLRVRLYAGDMDHRAHAA